MSGQQVSKKNYKVLNFNFHKLKWFNGLHSRHYLAAARTMTIIIRTRFYDFIFTPLGFSYWVIFAGKRINGHDFF